MIDLISIHIPKTAGTSFYDILRQVYPVGLSPSYRRRDLVSGQGVFEWPEKAAAPSLRVVHGHFTWREVQAAHVPGHTRVITWFRDPVDRVISNYLFFIDRLRNPQRNPEVYRHNAHRTGESLLEYAHHEENRNRMCFFVEGMPLEEFFFIGFTETFESDVLRLGALMAWPDFSVRQLNPGTRSVSVTAEERRIIEDLNRDDRQLYDRARAMYLPSPTNNRAP